MKLSKNYILLLERHSDDLTGLKSWLERMRYPVVVTHSTEQMMAIASQASPYLVILAGFDQEWSEGMVNQLRSFAATGCITIIALTDTHSPSWLRQEENPGFDGFLVKPVQSDILASLVYSARARQNCHSVV